MEEIVRDVERSFAYGQIEASVTLQGDGAENRQGVLDQIASALSGALSDALIPHFNRALKKNEHFEKGETSITQELKLQFLETLLFLRFNVRFNIEIPEDQKKSVECFLMELLAPEVASIGLQVISQRLKHDYAPQGDHSGRSPLEEMGGVHIPGVGLAIPLGGGMFGHSG